MRRAINGRASYIDVREKFGPRDAAWADERDTTVACRVIAGQVEIPPTDADSSLLLICRLARDGVHWHHHALYDIILPKVTIGGEPVDLRSTPHRWHEEAGGWSWILFEAPVRESSLPRTATFEITAYAPASVDLSVSVRVLGGCG
jgi:hypothetical protein